MSNDIKKIRSHLAAHRTIARNLRLRRYQGRNSASTERALKYHYIAAMELLRLQDKALQGELWAEHQTAARLSEARDSGLKRPELQRRLAAHRREIKAQVAA